MIIAIANENGGPEKSILSANLTALRAIEGRKVLLLDTDPGHLSLNWSVERGVAGIKPKVPAHAMSGKGLQPELENLMPRYDDILIDTENRDCLASRSALISARVVLISVRPDQTDLARNKNLIARIDTARLFNPALRVLFVIVCGNDEPSAEDVAKVRTLVAKIMAATLADTVIHEQAATSHAFDKGLSLAEYQPANTPAIAEIQSLYHEVFKSQITKQ